MEKPVRSTSIRNRLARAMTVPTEDFVPPSFGISFTKKSPQTKVDPFSPQPITLSLQSPPPHPKPQASVAVSHNASNVPSSPVLQRVQTVTKQARPGSVFISRSSPVDINLTEQCLKKPGIAATITKAITATITTEPKTTTSSRVLFVPPTTQDVEAGLDPVVTRLAPYQASVLQCNYTAPPNSVSLQKILTAPMINIFDSQPITSTALALQQPLTYPASTFKQPILPHATNQPAFAVIAQDPSALQALLSGDFGGRTFLIHSLQQPYIIPQIHPASQSIHPTPFTASHASPQLPIYSEQPPNSQMQQGLPVTIMQQQTPVFLQPSLSQQHRSLSHFPGCQISTITTPQPAIDVASTIAFQKSASREPLEISMRMPLPTIAFDEPTPSVVLEPIVTSAHRPSAPQMAPRTRSPPRSLQVIFNQSSHQTYQSHGAHKITLREPQKLSTPTFLQPLHLQRQHHQPMSFIPSREVTLNPPRSNPLTEYVEKLRSSPPKVNRGPLESRATKSKRMQESEKIRVEDSSMISVIDRARMWQQERRLEEASQEKSGFVDQDLFACGDELVPVEERVRAFNTGQVVEENEAAKKKMNKELEEERNRRIREQLFTTNATLRTSIPLNNKSFSRQRISVAGPIQPLVTHGDTPTIFSAKEKGNLSARRPCGGRSVPFARGAVHRRKTQPVTLDDIARINQCILEGGSIIKPETPLEYLRTDDLQMGSCLSSPAASVISEFSELVYAQTPLESRQLRIS